MKVERQLRDPRLCAWALSNPPSGMRVKRVVEGYAYGYYVYPQADVPWIGRGHPIAELYSGEIHLFEPNYFADMERLAQAYERETGHEITLKYWQSPKDAPLA